MRLTRRVLAAIAAGGALAVSAQTASPPDIFVRADKGHCIACHQLPEGQGPASRADLGPRLAGARMRAMARAGVREAIVDPTRANPGTLMPPYGRHRILEAAEIDTLVEYLHALP